ncbi:zeatin O-glucosyltransferase-like [Diospyros lotus]|uniref:zeatin O-glucosyltransferase-like n=1 Tax=Diospyros lotus TaxID=55363 RepID=UPI00224E7D88|nr:zeatin O-glucosyltransferase-like [Diospyros lotus]
MDELNQCSSNDDRSSSKEAKAVVMVPFPCQSHLNQLLQLACLISSYRNNYNGAMLLQVHYACAATHIHQAKLRFNDQSLLQAANIHFHELRTPVFLNPSPDPNASGAATKFPAHLQPSFDSSLHLRQPLAALLQKISTTARRVIVVHDALMAYAVQDIATIPTAESYGFNPTSSFSSLFDGWQLMGKSFQIEEPEGLPSLDGCYTSEILNFIALHSPLLKFRAGTICNTCRTIEGTYLDFQRNQHSNKQLWAIGPLNLALVKDYDQSRRLINSQHKCLEWLDKQATNSVLYVSFGTTTSLTNEEIKELAVGLEESKQKFIWVLRDADKGDIFEGDINGEGGSAQLLPEGYEERIKEVGMVVRDWAPQLEILGHESTGGFMSHCGWNSCMESMSMGVPIAAWPMHSDQPKNAFLVTQLLKVGVAVKQWPLQPDKDEIVSSSTISEAVKRLMASKQGEEMRKRAEKLRASIRQSVMEGGASRLELDSFIAHITSKLYTNVPTKIRRELHDKSMVGALTRNSMSS